MTAVIGDSSPGARGTAPRWLRDVGGDVMQGREAESGIHGFPAVLTSFIGRDSPVREVAGLLEECRLVTVTGPGGSGKTRLAGQVARREAGRFADGAWLVELALVQDPAQVVAAVAVALGIRDQPGVPAEQVLAQVLARQQVLLVIDNCEHVIGAVARLCAGLLAACDDVRVLATSREPLAVAGEARYRLAPLSLPGADGDAGGSEAVVLFADRARRADARFTLDRETGDPGPARGPRPGRCGAPARRAPNHPADRRPVRPAQLPGRLRVPVRRNRPAEAITMWAAFAVLLGHGGGAQHAPALVRRRAEPLRAARQAPGPDRARAAEDRGAAMNLATAAEYALMLTAPNAQQAPPQRLAHLSTRERELVTLVAQGCTDAQIAAELYISVRTVRTHLDRIRDKTGCRRRADLTRLALQAELA
jgi:DNA-binding CsgD family transcriptional regulator